MRAHLQRYTRPWTTVSIEQPIHSPAPFSLPSFFPPEEGTDLAANVGYEDVEGVEVDFPLHLHGQ